MRKLALLLLLTGTLHAAPPGWLSSLDEGTTAAARSGKPVLVVTIWKPGT